MIWLASLPAVASILMDSLERAYPRVPVTAVPRGDCIVLLGGMAKPSRRFAPDAGRIPAGSRLEKTAALFRAGKAEAVIVAAGGALLDAGGETEADRALPDRNAIAATHRALHEWAGWAYYSLRGWL